MQHHSTVDAARKHLSAVDPTALRHARDRLAETGIARLGFLLPHRVKRTLAAEALALVDHHLDWEGPGQEAPGRHTVDIDSREVVARSQCIPQLYDCKPLRHKLTEVASQHVLPCPAPRRFTVRRRHHDDVAGRWHWDDYTFALVLVVECPPLEDGGFVQTVAHTTRSRFQSEVYRTLTRNPIHSHELQAGDLYLMRTDTTLHRVHPFAHGRRTVVGMHFASAADLARKQITSYGTGSLRSEVRVITNQAQ
ncbi:hypothetical protein GFY24_28625 [Nocardia sp. SYP-A9097]|uniref:HalD/BesD family halogenase n=1 Tax=Nocardia sp. SYP-A9097 TaxID=2663237 RepID=UPI00129ADC71|nr:hypothetical protein [Nocardia sp. SYP-A9097]MRH91359.1 hypothetical protein [Nocardia sp. SYP-A9097]